MKTILSKFRYLLIFVMLLVGVAGAFADDDSTNPPITFQNVKAGTLRSLITRPERVTNLKLSGELNADDIMFIREMAACLKVDTIKGKEKKYRCDGHLQHLDISDVTLVPGTMKLWLDNWSYSPYIHKDGISYVFADLQSLQTIKLPNSLIRIGYYCFKNCRALVSITLPSELKNFYQFSVEGCSKLASIVTDESNSYFSSEGSVLFNKDKTEIVCAVNLTDYAVPSSVLKIGSYAFYGCSGLTSLTLPSGLTEIGESAFSGCSGLTSLTLPSGLTEIGNYAFYGCRGIVSLTLPSSLTKVGNYAFYGCRGLASLPLPSGLTKIGNYAFYGCRGLASLTLPSSLTKIGEYAFSGCSGITSLTLSSGLAQIKNGTFSGCSGITSLTIPSNIALIGDSAFWGCSGITSLTLSDVAKIGNSAFSGCSGLHSVTFPSGLTHIGDMAFSDCSGLKSLTLPSGLKYIEPCAFGGANGIKTIYAYMPIPTERHGFDGTVEKTATLYVPMDSYQQYLFSDTWGNFMNIKTFDPTPVESVVATDSASEVSRYTVDGKRQNNPVKGLNIVKMSDGTVRKVMVK